MTSPGAQPERTRVYVCGHRNPDTDSIASAIGYAELKNHLDTAHNYVPVRLGVANAQTSWLLERAGAPVPVFLPHAKLRVRDVMRASSRSPTGATRCGRSACSWPAKDVVPIVDDDGVLRGVLTERALARRYIRESREASRLDAPTAVASIVSVLEGDRSSAARRSRRCAGGCGCRRWTRLRRATSRPVTSWWSAIATTRSSARSRRGLAARAEQQRVAVRGDRGAGGRGRNRDRDVAAGQLRDEPDDHAVRARHAFVEGDPLTVGLDDLVSDIAEQIKTCTTARRSRSIAADGRSGSSPARISSTPRRGRCCSSTTPSARRACTGSRTPRSSRSSTTTTSARSRPSTP